MTRAAFVSASDRARSVDIRVRDIKRLQIMYEKWIAKVTVSITQVLLLTHPYFFANFSISSVVASAEGSVRIHLAIQAERSTDCINISANTKK